VPPHPARGFWPEFWPKALFIAALLAALALLEHYGLISRW